MGRVQSVAKCGRGKGGRRGDKRGDERGDEQGRMTRMERVRDGGPDKVRGEDPQAMVIVCYLCWLETGKSVADG
jgi:hypothetical protein